MLPRLERRARLARVLPLAVRDVPDPQRRDQLDPQLHAVVDRAWFLGFIGVVAAFSVALIFWRLPLLRTPTRLESLASREAAFLYNNLLLVAFALTVLWGVAFPLLSEAVRGEAVTVGPPYYNFFLRVFGLPLLLLMGIGPLVAWRRASLRSLGASLAVARSRSRSPPACCCSCRRRLEHRPASSRYTFCGLRARARSCSSSRAGRARGRRSARRAGSAPSARSSRATGAATAATSSTSRSCCSRSASSGRAPTARRGSRTCSQGETMAIGGYTAHLPRHGRSSTAANHDELRGAVRRLPRRQAARRRTWPARTTTRREQTSNEVGDPHRLAARGGPVHDRRRLRHGRLVVREGARQPARQPDLARRARVPARLADRAVAGRARAAAAGRAPASRRSATP